LVYRISAFSAKAKRTNRLDFHHEPTSITDMVDLEVYAAGVRNPEKVMALGLELDVIPGLRYKVDTNHDIVYMEFNDQVPTVSGLQSVFRKLGLDAKFVGQMPPEVSTKKKTQRIDL